MSLLVDLCLRLAVLVLPRGSRERYAAEWRADLDGGDSDLAYAVSLLAHAVGLRRAITRPQGRRPFLCTIGRHDDVTVHDNPEDRKFTSHHCRRCGRIKDDWSTPVPINGFALGGLSGGAGGGISFGG